VFDLVLSSHLLLTSADRLDRAFHRAALVRDLTAAGVSAQVRDVWCQFQRGARSLLELSRG
jgi:hypothetical protein